MMQRLTGAVGSVVGKVRRLVRLDATPDRRRQVFREEFGQNPPPHEATAAERAQFGREVVRPVLAQRARAVEQAGQDRGQQSAAQSTRGANEAFARAYQVAVDMGLAEKGQTYQGYLDHQE